MPAALRIFVWSLLAGITGGYVTLRLGFWIVAKYFHDDPLAIGAALLPRRSPWPRRSQGKVRNGG